MGNGDVHYNTFDRTPHDNQGFCQYVLSTNVDCGTNWPIDANNYDWAKWRYKEYFMVVADHSSIPLSTHGYNQEVSRLTGLQIYFTAKSREHGSIWRLTIGEDMSGWKLQYWNVNFGWLKVTCGSACSWTNAEGNFIGSWNSPDKNMAMRVNGATTDIYLGAGRRGDTAWSVQNNSPVRDYLVRIEYTKDQFDPSTYSYEGWYGSVNIYPNCDLANQVCGVCGDYNNQADFNQVGNKRDWERVLERTHFWNLPRMTEGELRSPPTFTEPHQCPYTNLDGNPVPTQELAQRNNGRKKRSVNCLDRDAYQRACSLILESPFDTCDLPKQPLIDNCVFDACATGGAEPFVEGILAQYVRQCNSSPDINNRIQSWRTDNFYPKVCGANSEYHSCTAHSCHGVAGECNVDQNECEIELEYTCIEGCFCSPGFVQHPEFALCVPATYDICPDIERPDPCANNPCNADTDNAHHCEAIISDLISETASYRCYCANRYFGDNCEHPPQCTSSSCTGYGDPRYVTFDGTAYNNMGFCQYVVSTNADCGANWPIDTNNYDWTRWWGQQYFMVVADHDPIPAYGYNYEISKISGIQIFFSARSGGLWRLTKGYDTNGWKLQNWKYGYYGWNKRYCGAACSWTNAEGHYIGSWNHAERNIAMRVNGFHTTIYIGAGRSGDTSWYSSNNSPVNDYLVKVHYIEKPNGYGAVIITANCELANNVCGACGDYNGQPDFNRVGNTRDWERDLERKHFWNMPRLTEGELSTTGVGIGTPTFIEPHQCPYTNLDGNPVPTQELAQRRNGRKKRQTSVDCPDISIYQTACNKILESPFDACTLPKENLIRSCVADACATGGAEPFVENMLSQYVFQCNESPALSDRIQSWRTADFYPLTCGANSEYHSCTAHSCHGMAGECNVDQRECQMELQYSCIEGCFCKPGFILNGIDCVEITPAICPDPVEVLEVEIQNTSQLIEHSLTTEAVNNLSVDDFLSHGCYCSRLDNSEVNKGKAVSQLDQVCRQLSHCDKCSVEDECADASGYPFFVKSGNGNSLVCDDTKNSQCQQAQCECSVTAADNIIEYVRNENMRSIEAESCVAKAGEGKSFECCGAGNHWMLYDASSNLECGLDSENLPILTEIGSPENVRRQFPGKN